MPTLVFLRIVDMHNLLIHLLDENASLNIGKEFFRPKQQVSLMIRIQYLLVHDEHNTSLRK